MELAAAVVGGQGHFVQARVGLGQGRDTTASNDPDDNGSPLWLTPICTCLLYTSRCV